jgi:hypothetical protein
VLGTYINVAFVKITQIAVQEKVQKIEQWDTGPIVYPKIIHSFIFAQPSAKIVKLKKIGFVGHALLELLKHLTQLVHQKDLKGLHIPA